MSNYKRKYEDNAYMNNVHLMHEMKAGRVEAKASFIDFVEGLQALYSEALSIRSHIFDAGGRDFQGWVYFKADKITTPGGFQIAHHSAKADIFSELLEIAKAGGDKPSNETMQKLTHKWDMWHYS